MPVAALIPAAASVVVGGIQAISGGIKARNARRAISKIQNPVYAPSKSIMDFYQTALNRAQTGPYNTAAYQQLLKGANTSLGSGINALQDRRIGGAGIGALVQNYNDTLQKGVVNAENQQRANIAQQGQAAGQLTQDQRFAYEQNQVNPTQRALQLQYAMLGGANQNIGAGVTNIMSGIELGGDAYLRSQYPNTYIPPRRTYS